MKKYFLFVNGYNAGPYSLDELRMMNITPNTPVWFDGLGSWRNANEIPELQSLFNPQAFNPQQTGYIPPAYGNQNYGQANPNYSQPNQNYTQPNPVYQTPPQNNNSTKKILLILGSIFLVLILSVGFFIYQQQQKRKKAMEEFTQIMDSLQKSEVVAAQEAQAMQDSLRQADSAYQVQESHLAMGSSQYAGNYSNLYGGTLQITGDRDDNLQIYLSFKSESGNCSGEIDGTGAVKGTDKIVMRTSGGCKITLDVSGTIISVSESGSCSSYHGESCTFDGLYSKQ
jgi:hypothetical protein